MGKRPIKYIHVFGMQCSGTNHLEKTLQLNLPDNSPVLIKGNLLGWKHDDIWSPSGFADENNERILFDARAEHETIYDSLFIVMYRNPIAWMRSYHSTPHHVPHMHNKSFTDFVSRPFELFFTPPGGDVPRDNEHLEQITRPDRLWERYPNVMTMRKVKIDLFESFKYRLPNVCYVNLESFNENPQQILEAISEHYGLSFKPRFVSNTSDKHASGAYKPKEHTGVRVEDYFHIFKHLSVGRERRIGYHLKAAYVPLQLGRRLNIPSNPNRIFMHNRVVRAFSHEYGDAEYHLIGPTNERFALIP